MCAEMFDQPVDLPREWSSLNIHFMFAVSGLFPLNATNEMFVFTRVQRLLFVFNVFWTQKSQTSKKKKKNTVKSR